MLESPDCSDFLALREIPETAGSPDHQVLWSLHLFQSKVLQGIQASLVAMEKWGPLDHPVHQVHQAGLGNPM